MSTVPALQIAPLCMFASCCVFVLIVLSNYQLVFVFLSCETRQNGSGMLFVSPYIKSIQCICLFVFLVFCIFFWDFETQWEQEWNVPPYQNHPNAPRLDVPPSHRVPQIHFCFVAQEYLIKYKIYKLWKAFLATPIGHFSQRSAQERVGWVQVIHQSMFASTTAVTSLTPVQIMTSKFNLSLVYIGKGNGPCCLHSSFIWFISTYSYLNFPCGWSEWPSRKSAPHASVPPTGLPSCPPQSLRRKPS